MLIYKAWQDEHRENHHEFLEAKSLLVSDENAVYIDDAFDKYLNEYEKLAICLESRFIPIYAENKFFLGKKE